MTVHDLPAVNATLNSFAGLFLGGGWYAIRKKQDIRLHAICMVSALVCSALFLSSYTYYHYHAGMTRYSHTGPLRYIYLFILATHVPLAIAMVPFVLAAVFFALRRRFDRHVMITQRLWPVWMYVSVTGVIIYLMLYKF